MEVSYKTIGSNIRKARKAMHLTQAQTAEKLGMSPLHYGRLERGDRNVSLAQLAQAASVLHTPFHALLAGSVADENGIVQQISNTFFDIPDEDKHLIAELYQVIKKYNQ